jgi:hypothetical protein
MIAAAKLVEELCYNEEVLGSNTDVIGFLFKLFSFFQPQYDPRVYSSSDRNEYQKYFRE